MSKQIEDNYNPSKEDNKNSGKIHFIRKKLSLPNFNNNREFGRLNLEHCLYRYQWQGNFSSPIEQQLKEGKMQVLNIGSGTCAWVMDMATEYPKCTFLGLDTSPIFLTEGQRLPNTGFMQSDVLNNETFDFVSERFLIYASTNSECRLLFNEMCRVLKPGGWIELMEFRIGYENYGPITKSGNDQVLDYLRKKGIYSEMNINMIPQLIQDSPCLTNFYQLEKKGPIGNWGGEFGSLMLENYKMSRRSLNSFAKLISDNEHEEFIKQLSTVMTALKLTNHIGKSKRPLKKYMTYGILPIYDGSSAIS
ncbi:6073_t:CDS:2 [Diversispora eburnea]|uniref:6073_t:CDS:1 n=1 Tax=Diversispora eburnea TaxID=1213867 RepID=A0A9N8UWZ9_9GLOM|nr:6073_t:CDS:2 [Diversispora eburnea]